MKTGRNDLCPCGSGKKYKKCCISKSEEEKLAEAIGVANDMANRDGRINDCIYPLKHECDDRIVKAHAIQNNRILKKIAENGRLITTNGVSNLLFQDTKINGRANATTFYGFCKYHDKTVFQEIEDKTFTATSKQLFLLAYRTFAWHYHKKREQHKRSVIFECVMKQRGYASNTDEDSLWKKGISLGLRDNDEKKAWFDAAIRTSNYDVLDHCVWIIPYEVQFAVSMMYEMMYDIEGKRINAQRGNLLEKSIFLNIFPTEGESYCVWSWFKTDSEYRRFTEQFMNLDTETRFNFLNNKLPEWTDSLVIAPKLWNYWKAEIQQAFIAHANMGDLYVAFELEDNGHRFEYADTPWDLFRRAEDLAENRVMVEDELES